MQHCVAPAEGANELWSSYASYQQEQAIDDEQEAAAIDAVDWIGGHDWQADDEE